MDLISRQAVIDLLMEYGKFSLCAMVNDNIPSAENKGDLISRQAVLDLFHMKYSDKELYKAIYELPSVENKGDLISRQMALNLKQTFTDDAGYETEYVDVEDIKELPSIPSVENKGEWIEYCGHFSDEVEYYECSCCKEPFVILEGTPQDNNYNFCPNCGADMRDKVESFYDRMTEELGEDWDVPLE